MVLCVILKSKTRGKQKEDVTWFLKTRKPFEQELTGGLWDHPIQIRFSTCLIKVNCMTQVKKRKRKGAYRETYCRRFKVIDITRIFGAMLLPNKFNAVGNPIGIDDDGEHWFSSFHLFPLLHHCVPFFHHCLYHFILCTPFTYSEIHVNFLGSTILKSLCLVTTTASNSYIYPWPPGSLVYWGSKAPHQTLALGAQGPLVAFALGLSLNHGFWNPSQTCW